MVTESRPFFTSHRPGEGIEGILPDKGCELPSPNQSTSIGISKRIRLLRERLLTRPMLYAFGMAAWLVVLFA